MKIKKIKRVIYRRFRYLRFWKKFMFTYRRVRLTQEKIATPVEPTEIIKLPDLEMWAIYSPQGEISYLHFNEESAAHDCLDRLKEEKKLQKKGKSTKIKKK